MHRPLRPVFLVTLLCFTGTTLSPAYLRAQPAPAEADAAKPKGDAPADDTSAADPKAEADAEAAAEAKAEAEADAQAEKEAEAEMEGTNITKPPAKGKGAIVGIITDTKFSEAVIEAHVQVLGQKRQTFTDTDGKFRLELPPGTYSIRISYEMHQPTRVDSVKVEAGKLVQVDAQLTPDEKAVETVVIEEEADKTSLEGQSLERKRSAVVSDGVGRAEIARTPDRNAAEAARRVVGATIVDGRFVFVRGLGERYTNALLNGTPLPSPEPDRQTVPLDLFPALVLDSVTITKQFTPDMPADFAGGSVRIYTREFPRERLFQVSLNAGVNTEATFTNHLSYPGSNTDFLGYDSGIRGLPKDLPKEKLEAQDENTRVTWGRRLNSFMSGRQAATPPNHGLSIVAGDSFKLGPDRKLGMLAALSYNRGYQVRHTLLRNYTTDVRGLRTADSFDGVQGIDSVRWGAFGSVTYESSKHTKYALTGLHSQSADDTASQLQGSFDGNSAVFRPLHLEYISRRLDFAQLRGTHDFPSLNRLTIEWNVALSKAVRDQPDTRDVRYLQTGEDDPGGAGYVWAPDLKSGSHLYLKQNEQRVSGGLDVTQPLTKSEDQETKLKLGTLITSRDRFSTARRFVFEPPRRPGAEFRDATFCPGTTWRDRCPDNLFRNFFVGPDGLMVRETTQRFDEYSAGLDVYAAYAMVDSQLTKRWRAIGGARIEATQQSFVAYDPFDRAGTILRSSISSTDVLPALSVVFAADKKTNARFGASQTLARPQLREITPFLSSSYTAEYPIQGNPDLKLTKVTNLDLRLEHFPTLRQVLAVSLFYKHFKNPIEDVILPGAAPGLLTYANVDGANLLGLELEARKGLGFMTKLLDDFMIIGNLTLAKSRVELGENAGAATVKTRSMAYQSDYVLNLSLDYANEQSGTDIRALYNVYGPRIVGVGSQGLPDTYEQPRNVVDLSVAQKMAKHFDLKVTAQNLLGAPVVYAHRGAIQVYREVLADGSPGRLFAHKDPETRRYQPGVTFTVSAQYTY